MVDVIMVYLAKPVDPVLYKKIHAHQGLSLIHIYLSSTIMKEVAGYDGDLSKFAPPEITEAVKKKMHDLKK